MSLEERVAQMFIVTPEALTGVSGAVTRAGDITREAFARFPVGGVIYMGQNLVSCEQTKGMLADMQTISIERTGLPAFLCVDEEGGSVARISGSGRFDVPRIESMNKVKTEERAGEIGKTIGGYLSDLGFNVDLAPCADVLTNAKNTVVKARSFGKDPQNVALLAGAYAEGLIEHGVLPTYKHFPGHGATSEDSHEGYAVSERSLDELYSGELVPFIDAAERGIPFIMTGHITVPKVSDDGLPASLSPALTQSLLRETLGYRGVIITDSLNMGAITQRYTPGEAAVMALLAGNDMLLFPDSLEERFGAILEAVRTGRITEERIDESARRIISLKLSLSGGGI